MHIYSANILNITSSLHVTAIKIPYIVPLTPRPQVLLAGYGKTLQVPIVAYESLNQIAQLHNNIRTMTNLGLHQHVHVYSIQA